MLVGLMVIRTSWKPWRERRCWWVWWSSGPAVKAVTGEAMLVGLVVIRTSWKPWQERRWWWVWWSSGPAESRDGRGDAGGSGGHQDQLKAVTGEAMLVGLMVIRTSWKPWRERRCWWVWWSSGPAESRDGRGDAGGSGGHQDQLKAVTGEAMLVGLMVIRTSWKPWRERRCWWVGWSSGPAESRDGRGDAGGSGGHQDQLKAVTGEAMLVGLVVMVRYSSLSRWRMLPIVVGVSVAPSGFLFRDANSVAWVVLVRYLASQRASSFLGILKWDGYSLSFPAYQMSSISW